MGKSLRSGGKYQISLKNRTPPGFPKKRGVMCLLCTLKCSTGRQPSQFFLCSKKCCYSSVILRSHRIWTDSRFSKGIWSLRLLAPIFAVFRGSLQNVENEGNITIYGSILGFPWSWNMPLRASWSVWKLITKTLGTLSTCLLPSHSRWCASRQSRCWVKSQKISIVSKNHIFQSVAPLVAGMELHRSPSDPRLNLPHFITWVYWDWRRCKKNPKPLLNSRSGAQHEISKNC